MSHPVNTDYDLLIIGGGMVGASLAVALAHQPLRIGIIENTSLSAKIQPSYDDRVIALSYGSQRIFKAIGIWDALQHDICPINKIHISNRGHSGFTHLNAQDESVEALGYVVPGRSIGQALHAYIKKQSNIDFICPAHWSDFTVEQDHISLSITTSSAKSKTVTARLLVAADGGQSVIREKLGIQTTIRDYQQSAIITNITPEQSHHNIAYERFTDTGPLAMLPMTKNRCSVVWTARTDQQQEILDLDDETFLKQLQKRFGYRLGRLTKVGSRHAYPLKLIQSLELVRPRIAIIGNAAHTLHPLAGQGFNLGLRDVAALAETIVTTSRKGDDSGDIKTLEQYAEARKKDHRTVLTATDTLVRLFIHPFMPVALARNKALTLLDLFPPAKHLLARHAMGIAGKQSRLTRGVSL